MRSFARFWVWAGRLRTPSGDKPAGLGLKFAFNQIADPVLKNFINPSKFNFVGWARNGLALNAGVGDTISRSWN